MVCRRQALEQRDKTEGLPTQALKEVRETNLNIELMKCANGNVQDDHNAESRIKEDSWDNF